MPPEFPETPRRVSLLRLAIVILVVVGLGVLVWAIFFRQSNPTNTGTNNNPPQTTQTQQKPKSTEKPSSGSSSSSSTSPSSISANSNTATSQPSTSTPSTPAQKSTSPSPASTTPSSTQQSPQLANTGPGDTVALFLGVSFVAALLRYAYLRRHRDANFEVQ